jgi:hypothetical protein
MISAAVTVLVMDAISAIASGTSGTLSPSVPVTPAQDPFMVTTAIETPRMTPDDAGWVT